MACRLPSEVCYAPTKTAGSATLAYKTEASDASASDARLVYGNSSHATKSSRGFRLSIGCLHQRPIALAHQIVCEFASEQSRVNGNSLLLKCETGVARTISNGKSKDERDLSRHNHCRIQRSLLIPCTYCKIIDTRIVVHLYYSTLTLTTSSQR